MRVFHAHIYFALASRPTAEEVREKASRELTYALGVSRLIDRPVGPHPLPMFEIDFEYTHLGELVAWIHSNRNGLNVLIHEDRKPETIEHTVNAIWIGIPQKLDLSQLDLGTDAVHDQVMGKKG